MRLRKIAGADEAISAHPRCFDAAAAADGKWRTPAVRGMPLCIEIGMGKGRFITTLAAQNPQKLYIGIERYTSVLYRALQKYDSDPLANLLFFCADAKCLDEVFRPGEVGRIYLNFSDPWPKERHAKRRLTSQAFLQVYARILKPGGQLEFKTDNQELFTYSIEQAQDAGWRVDAATRDLHHDPVLCAGNIMTEYEERFSAQGNPICKMILSR